MKKKSPSKGTSRRHVLWSLPAAAAGGIYLATSGGPNYAEWYKENIPGTKGGYFRHDGVFRTIEHDRGNYNAALQHMYQKLQASYPGSRIQVLGHPKMGRKPAFSRLLLGDEKFDEFQSILYGAADKFFNDIGAASQKPEISVEILSENTTAQVPGNGKIPFYAVYNSAVEYIPPQTINIEVNGVRDAATVEVYHILKPYAGIDHFLAVSYDKETKPRSVKNVITRPVVLDIGPYHEFPHEAAIRAPLEIVLVESLHLAFTPHWQKLVEEDLNFNRPFDSPGVDPSNDIRKYGHKWVLLDEGVVHAAFNNWALENLDHLGLSRAAMTSNKVTAFSEGKYHATYQMVPFCEQFARTNGNDALIARYLAEPRELLAEAEGP